MEIRPKPQQKKPEGFFETHFSFSVLKGIGRQR